MKYLVTDFCSFDVRRLKREGCLSPNRRFDWAWRNPRGEEEISITVTVLYHVIEIEYTVPEEADRYVHVRIPLCLTRGARGAKRPWCGCPTCRGRVAILYFTQDAFCCRTCAKLAYPSQYPSQRRSYARRHRCLSRNEQARYFSIDQHLANDH